MFKIEINNRISQIIQTFYRLGIWRNEEQYSVLRKVGWKFLFLIFYVCYSVSLIAGGFLSDNKNESIFLISAGILVAVASVKLIYILWKKEQICAFITKIGIHSIENKKEFIKINNKLNNLMQFSFCFLLISIGTCGLIFCLPAFASQKMLPLNIWFPLDWKNNAIFYGVGYVFITTGAMTTAIAIPLNVIIWYLMMNCAIKYQILGNQFRNIVPTKKKWKISEERKQKIFLGELIGLTKTHQNIQETINQFKSCFANLFFAQITTSGISICSSVYILAFGKLQENLLQSEINVVFMVYNIFDIFMVTYLGNEIKLSSDRLSYCFFESNWMEQSNACRKYIIILTEVLKKPHELVIGKLYPLTLETFTAILRLAYSAFNILQNFN